MKYSILIDRKVYPSLNEFSGRIMTWSLFSINYDIQN